MLAPLGHWFRLAVLAAGLLLAAASMAQLPAADEQAIQSVVLNDWLLDTLIAIRADGDVFSEAEDDSDDAGQNLDILESVDSMVRAATREPKFTALLNKHGISARDYVIASIAVMRAGMAVQFGSAATPQAQGATAQNIAFVRSRMDKVQLLFSRDDDEE